MNADKLIILTILFSYLSIGFLLWLFIIRKTIDPYLKFPFLFLTMLTWICVPDIIYDEYKRLKYLKELERINSERI